jgi:allantoinase
MFDLLFKNLRVVRPGAAAPERLDLAVSGGKIAALGAELPASLGRSVVDGKGRLAFPGVVDAHTHVGIYRPLEVDAETESRAAAMGGVTTLLSYMRTGQYYLDKGGPYAEVLPEILARSHGRFAVDYGYHLAPIQRRHIGEMELLYREFGVTSFKIFMFYGNHGLHGRSGSQREFLKLEDGDHYDFAHFEFIMRELARLADAVPGARQDLSLSLHCELGDILNAYTALVERQGQVAGLAAYSAARPPHSEGLAIFVAAYLADETRCPKVNLLHLTSKKAIEAALTMQRVFPHVDFKREVTIGHLLLDTDAPAGILAKVNPPIRPRADVERLWQAVLASDVDWIVSDHACCAAEQKTDAKAPSDVWKAKSGFGGTEYLLPGLISEGRRRGLSYGRMAELVCAAPARRFGLRGKGDLAVGFDADLAIVDDTKTWTVDAAGSPSGQGYTPFAGMELTARVEETWLRGERIWDGHAVVGPPRGRYLRRPYGTGAVAAAATSERQAP